MEIDTGDTAWILTSTALVMLMTPALGFFYGGLVRRKNVLSTIMHSFIILALISVVWVLWGYSLAFGPDKGGLIGGLEWIGLRGVTQAPSAYAPSVPHLAFMAFQLMFAVITPALISGAFAERMRFGGFVIFSVLWVTLVYAPIAHWVWADGGWLRRLGVLDFAGGSVVHLAAGVSALVAARVLGQRIGFGRDPLAPHDLTYTILGTGLLWFGWFGFNGGSALAANGLAANAFVVTNTAAAMGALTWVGLSWWRYGQPSALAAAAGAIAGLVAGTPASGFVSPMTGILLGLGAGVLCFFGTDWVKRVLGIDDALDVFAVHGLCGIWGLLLTGLFAERAINAAGADGLVFGNASLVVSQVIAIAAVGLYAAVVSWLLLRLVNAGAGLRVAQQDETAGLDQIIHGEAAYEA